MQNAFLYASEKTIAENAVLQLSEITAEAQCNLCNHIFQPEIDNYLCPSCLIANVKVTKGNDVIIKSITGKQ